MEQNTQFSENNSQMENNVNGEQIFNEPKKKSNKKIVLLVVVVIVLLGAVASYFLFFSNKENNNTPVLEDKKAEEIKVDKELDSDQDRLPDYIEKVLGTDLNNSDTDGDGYSDFEEIKNGYDPLSDKKFTEKEWEGVKLSILKENKELYEEFFVGFNEIADWKIYRNEEYGYEVKYPLDWKGFGENKDRKVVAFSANKEEDMEQIILYKNGFWIYIYENPNVTFEEWLGSSYKGMDSFSIQKDTIEISGIDATVYTENLLGITYYLIPRNSDNYVIGSTINEKRMRQILSTFKFIDKK